MDIAKSKYNEKNENGIPNWDTLKENLVTLANEIIPKNDKTKKKEIDNG